MLIQMCGVIPAIRWTGLRDDFGLKFPRACSYPSKLNKSSGHTPPLCRLLGPPEIHNLNICPSKNPFPHQLPSLEKRDFSTRFVESPHPCLELFITINQSYLKDHHFLIFLLENSWNHDSLTTLKIIGYMKQYSHTIKYGGREQFYTAALWLHTSHPKSLANNVKVFSKFGCLKDWLEILYRLIKGPLARQVGMSKRSGNDGAWHDLGAPKTKEESNKDTGNKSCLREEKRIQMARQAIEMYNLDPNYRFLYDKISDLFAELLKSDLELLDSGGIEKISLASKWCPSIDSSYDSSTLFCESVARRLFPYDSNPEYRGLDEAHYAYRVRRCLQKRVLVPLRKALKLPEIYMTSNQWNLLPYDCVSFTAMQTYERSFMKHDNERFLQYIQQDGKKRPLKRKINSGREMYPHDIFRLLDCGYDVEVAEVQWRRTVQAFSEKGKFKNCIVFVALEDEEMEALPKLVQHFSLSCQLIASDLSESPWNGNILRQIDDNEKIIEWSKVEGDDFLSKMKCLKSLCSSIKFINVWLLLDKILETAVCGRVSREKMVRRLFVFGLHIPDFDIRYSTDIRAEYEAKRKQFEDCGYAMPDILFWEMVHCPNHPHDVTHVEFFYKIVSIHRLSQGCIQVFWDEDGKVETNTTMLDSQISGEDYMEFKVFH